MKPDEASRPRKVPVWKQLVPDFKLIFRLWLPLFVVAVWFGIHRGYPDIGLFAVAMAVGVWSVCDAAVLTYRRILKYRYQRAYHRAFDEARKKNDARG